MFFKASYLQNVMKDKQFWFQPDDKTKYENHPKVEMWRFHITAVSCLLSASAFFQADCRTKRPLVSQRIVTISLNVDPGLWNLLAFLRVVIMDQHASLQ